jgi:phosphohistidine phosphatase SixA
MRRLSIWIDDTIASRQLHSFLLLILTVFCSVLLTPQANAADFQEKIADKALLKQLQQGGFVIYMRHGTTDNTRPDQAPSIDLNDCMTQRPLSDVGRQLSKQVGEYVRQAGIPHQKPIASPLCRAKETAVLAFGEIESDLGLRYSGSMTSADKVPVLARTRELLSLPVPQGTNRLLVAHAPNLMDIMGYFPKEGTLVIFKPEAALGFTYVGSIPPNHWSSILSLP